MDFLLVCWVLMCGGGKDFRNHVEDDEQRFVCSFAFLGDHHLLLAHMTPPLENGALTVVELAGELSFFFPS